jgi:hypothetical protein
MSQQHDDTGERGPAAPATPQEKREAERLREALAGRGEHPDAHLARALRAAWEPSELDAELGEKLVRRALERRRAPSGRVIYVAFGAAATLAVAAAVALVLSPELLGGGGTVAEAPAAISAPLARSRTTQALFDAPFARHGGASERIDRIAESRARDYRSNLYARLGVH